MRLAFSTNAYTRFSVEEAVRAIGRAGYAGAEVMADVPHAFPPRFPPARAERLRALADEAGLRFSNVNAFMLYGYRDCYHPSFIEPDPSERRRRVEHTRECIHLARAIGAPSISIEPGGPLDGASRETAWRWFVEGLQDVLALAERLHVDVLVEPEPGLLLETSADYDELRREVRSRRLGLNFDIGHFYCVGEDPARLVPRLASETRHYHVEDIAASREHRHLLPGEGAIDLPGVLRAIAATGYVGFLTVELYPYDEDPDGAAREAHERLRRILGTRREERPLEPRRVLRA